MKKLLHHKHKHSSQLFGVPLAELMCLPSQKGRQVPSVIECAAAFLRAKGLENI